MDNTKNTEKVNKEPIKICVAVNKEKSITAFWQPVPI